MCQSWINASNKYSWEVNLRHFRAAVNYSNYFNRSVNSTDVAIFEDNFRTTINEGGSFEIAGEVCFWKNYGIAQSRDKITQKLLKHLQEGTNWNKFIKAVKEISTNPSFNNFTELKNSCNQSYGFATPITFLAFYNPTEYPMADKHIANWWNECKAKYGFGDSRDFSQSNAGTIKSIKLNWNAYMDWKKFCCDYAERIAENCELNWRARDIEMAVWEAQKNGISLDVLP